MKINLKHLKEILMKRKLKKLLDAAMMNAFCLAVVNPDIASLDEEGQFMHQNQFHKEPKQVVLSTFKDGSLTYIISNLALNLKEIYQSFVYHLYTISIDLQYSKRMRLAHIIRTLFMC